MQINTRHGIMSTAYIRMAPSRRRRCSSPPASLELHGRVARLSFDPKRKVNAWPFELRLRFPCLGNPIPPWLPYLLSYVSTSDILTTFLFLYSATPSLGFILRVCLFHIFINFISIFIKFWQANLDTFWRHHGRLRICLPRGCYTSELWPQATS